MNKVVRKVVSKNKLRYVEKDIDLDLSYITPRIIAMGFPCEGSSALWRNPISTVLKLFRQKHGLDRVKVFNLCSERDYPLSSFAPGQCARVPFDDHTPSAFEQVEPACVDMATWLDLDPLNVIAVHCKAGKGRTGMMISCLLTYLTNREGQTDFTAADSLAMFAAKRTDDGHGVTIPSQRRWVFYWERYLNDNRAYEPRTLRLSHVRLVTIPNADGKLAGGGSDPFFVVKSMRQVVDADGRQQPFWRPYTVYDHSKSGATIRKCHPSERSVDLVVARCGEEVVVRGDVQVVVYDYDRGANHTKIASVWFNTHFVDRNFLVFEKAALDGACKDHSNHTTLQHFKLEIYLHKVQGDAEYKERDFDINEPKHTPRDFDDHDEEDEG